MHSLTLTWSTRFYPVVVVKKFGKYLPVGPSAAEFAASLSAFILLCFLLS